MLTGFKLKSNASVGTIATGGVSVQSKVGIQQKKAIVNDVTGVVHKAQINTNVADTLVTHTLKTKKQALIAASGLSTFRPEIVMGTRFEPAYTNTDEHALTACGEMLDVQITARNVRADNLAAFVDKLMSDDETAEIIDELSRSYTKQLDAARDDVRFMMDAYTVIDAVCRRLNVAGNVDALRRVANDMLDDDVDVYDIRRLFVDHMGFTHRGFDVFTNTKIFGQLMFDMCNAVRRHTYGLFNIVDNDRIDDVDPVTYDRTIAQPTGMFTFDLSNFGDAETAVNAFNVQTFVRFITSMPKARDDKLKLLSVTLARLYAASAALGSRQVQADLRRLNVPDGADDPFVDIIGVPGATILDDVDDRTTIMGLTQINDESVGVVLPFERRFIINKHGRKFTPGDDYFFDALVGADDFNITRITRFESAFEQRLTAAMNVFEAATRVDTPFTRQLLGHRRDKLTALAVHNRARTLVADVLSTALEGGQRGKNCMLMLAVINASMQDKQLKHLLFQTALLATLHMLLIDHTIDLEFVDVMLRNELKTFDLIPSLANFTANIPVNEAGVFQEVNIGELKTAGSSAIAIGAAFRQLQKLTFDRAFLALSQQSNVSAPNGYTSVQVEKPAADKTFDDDVAYVMSIIALLTDTLEDEAGSHGAIGRVRKRMHMMQDRSGRSRYLKVSASTRYMFTFELITTLLGSFDIVKFGNVNETGDQVSVFYDAGAIQSYIAALNDTNGSDTHVKQVSSVKFKASSTDVIPAQAFFVQGALTTATQVKVDDFRGVLDVVNRALSSDLDVIRSMALNTRGMIRLLDDAVDNLTSFFTTRDGDLIRTFGDVRTSARIGERIRRIGRRRGKPGGRRIRERRTLAEQRQLRTALLTRQQLALAIVKLNDLSLSNMHASPAKMGRFQGTLAGASDVFVDGSRITEGVRTALFSLLATKPLRARGHVKILTVAVPTGLAEQLADDVVAASNGDLDREADVISLNVHMRDLIENDIIFKPKRSLFELSRFVSAWSFDRRGSDVPFDELLTTVDMFDSSMFRNNMLRGQRLSDMIDSERYGFLENDAIRTLVANHVSSYLMGVYIRMLTSIDVREEAFNVIDMSEMDVDDSSTIELYTRLAEVLVSRSGGGVSLDELRDRFPAFDEMLMNIEEGELQTGVFQQRAIFDTIAAAGIDPLIAHEISDIAKLCTSRSSLTGGERLRKSITAPKLFERVFNVIVDPFEFEIDVTKTRTTAAGRSSYDRLRAGGMINEVGGREFMRRVDRDRTIMTEQYFVTFSRRT